MSATLAVSLSLWVIAAILALVAWRQGTAVLSEASRSGLLDFLYLIPRLAIGVIGAGFLAALLPQDVVRSWLGPESGISGLFLATLAGALLAVGAGVGPAVAFVTSWTLIGLNRAIIWEAPFLGVDFVTTRMLVSLPLPIVAGLLAHWLARVVPGGPR